MNDRERSTAIMDRIRWTSPDASVPINDDVRKMIDVALAAARREGFEAGAAALGLSFARLRAANVERCNAVFHPVSEWSPTDWACAVAGEVGEACNLIKKQRRGEAIPLDDIGRELADAVTYIDLLAEKLGIDLGAAVASKFDEVSKRLGYDAAPLVAPERDAEQK